MGEPGPVNEGRRGKSSNLCSCLFAGQRKSSRGSTGRGEGGRKTPAFLPSSPLPVHGRPVSWEARADALPPPHPPKPLSLRVVVTAGPTLEDIDPVRFLGNRSTGKMGFAVAERAAARGADVTLIAGPVSLPTPAGVRRVDVRSALDMQRALSDALGPDLGRADALVMTAAVADYRPAHPHAAKLKRTAERMVLELVPNPDLLAEIGAARAALPGGGRGRPVLSGFAVETDTDERVVAYARGKLEKKRVDLVVANHARDAFGRDDNRATLVEQGRVEPLGLLSKHALADRILDRIAALAGAAPR